MVGSEGVPLEIQNGLVRWSRVKDIGSHSREPSPWGNMPVPVPKIRWVKNLWYGSKR